MIIDRSLAAAWAQLDASVAEQAADAAAVCAGASGSLCAGGNCAQTEATEARKQTRRETTTANNKTCRLMGLHPAMSLP